MNGCCEILIRIRGKKATLAPNGTIPLNAGNADSYIVRFLIEPNDSVWANRSLSASFRARTPAGAETKDTAPVGVDCTAVIPASVLRERAARLEVGLAGIDAKQSVASTNLVSLGPVAHGAGGDGFFPDCPLPPHHGHPPHCGSQDTWNWERVWRMLHASMAGMESAVRRLMMLPLKPLQKINEQNGLPTWDGKAWPGAESEPPTPEPTDGAYAAFITAFWPLYQQFLGGNTNV